MINEHNLQISEQEYRDLDLPSYSVLSAISKQGVDVVNGVKQGNFVLKFGSLVDDMCFDTAKVKDKYYLAKTIKAPTINIKNIIDIVVKEVLQNENQSNFGIIKKKKLNSNSESGSDLNNYRNSILSASKKLGVYKNYSEDKIIETVVLNGQDYFSDIIDCRGKILIKKEMWDKAYQAATTLATHQFSSRYFEEEDGIEIFYQYKFIVNVMGRPTKGMLDILKVDHNTKTIYPVDLKTGELSVSKFPEIMLMHGYYIQATLYREAISNIVANDPDLKGYSVAEFEFLYISKDNPYKPLVYVFSNDHHILALNGFQDRYGTKHKGVKDLLEEYYNCKEGLFCQYTEEEYKQDGKIYFENDLMRKL